MRNLKFAIFMMFCFYFTLSNVNALEYDCSSSAIAKLKALAYNVTFTYDLYETKNEARDYRYYVSLDNLDDQLYVLSENNYRTELNVKKIEKFGKFSMNQTYSFEIRTTLSSSCPSTLLYTKYITFPWYNDYSTSEECIGIESYDLCQKWRKPLEYTEEEFLNKISIYKESLKPVLEEEETKEDKNLISQIIAIYTENIFLSVTLTIVICVLIIGTIVNIIIKKRNRIKIKI